MFEENSKRVLIPQIHNSKIYINMFHLCCFADIVRSDIALDKQKGCKLANHPQIMLELQREKAATTQLVLLKEQLSNIYSNITITGRRSHTQKQAGFFSLHLKKSHEVEYLSSFTSRSLDLRVVHTQRFQSMPLEIISFQNDKCNL